jgi:hypothetical protein
MYAVSDKHRTIIYETEKEGKPQKNNDAFKVK